jgi:hypothetical protein
MSLSLDLLRYIKTVVFDGRGVNIEHERKLFAQ